MAGRVASQDSLSQLAALETAGIPFATPRRVSLPRVAIALVLAAVLGMEAIWALLGTDFRDPHDVILAMYKPAPGVIFRSLPGETPLPNVTLNSEGFRGPEWTPKEPGEIRLLAIGDSTVFGYGTPLEDSWPEQAARMLSKKTGRKVTAWNLGRIGMSTEGNLADLREFGDRIQPDVLLLGVGGWNDFQRFHESPTLTEAEVVAAGIFAHQVEEAHSPLLASRFYQLWRARKWHAFDARNVKLTEEWENSGVFAADAPDSIARRVPPAKFTANLAAFCEWGAERKIPLFYAVGRLAEQKADAPFSAARYPIAERYRELVLSGVAACPGAHAVRSDEVLTSALQGMKPSELWWDHVHLTTKGNRMVAQAMADQLLAHWTEVAP